MDQRNAGQSSARVSPTDGWHVFTEDQLALMDHVGANRFHVAGMCIGGPYALGLIQAAPERVASAVLFQTIGLSDNRQAFYEMFDGWTAEQQPAHPEVTRDTWDAFKTNMFDGEFLFNVSREFVSACQTPLLVLLGTTSTTRRKPRVRSRSWIPPPRSSTTGKSRNIGPRPCGPSWNSSPNIPHTKIGGGCLTQ